MDNVRQEAEALFERVRSATGDEWREWVKTAPETVQKAFWALKKASFFSPENAVLEKRWEKSSPSGRYRLVVTPFQTGKGCRNYTQGCVYEGDRLIAEVRRNYSAFPYAWVEGHSLTGGDFLLCGEDYQGQSVVDLRSGEVKHTLPEEAQKGFGFCWASIHPSPSGRFLAVDGCYWACPYEVVFYDFSDPMCLPWLELDRNKGWEDFLGWVEGEDKARVGRRYEVCTLKGPLYGKREDDMTEEELGSVEEEAKRRGCGEGDFYDWEEEAREELWECPSNDSLARNSILILKDRQGTNLPVLQGWIDQIDRALARCTSEEKAAIETELEDLLTWLRDNTTRLT